jgi:cell division protein FtsB
MTPDQVIGLIIQAMALVAFLGIVIGIVAYVFPRTQVGKAAERYTDALEGENEVARRTIARLETEVLDLGKLADQLRARITQLEVDVASVKAENDRLRSENMRLHGRLAEHELDGQ